MNEPPIIHLESVPDADVVQVLEGQSAVPNFHETIAALPALNPQRTT